MHTLSFMGTSRVALFGALICSGALTITGCASNEPRSESLARSEKVNQVDPYEGFNRSMYGFNMSLDKYFLKPVSDGYKFVTPDIMETGVSNFFNNLKGINVVLNDMLQGKFEQGAQDSGRFLTNTTIGLGGLIDVASDLGLQNNVEDFGQTLAVWGVDQGAYLVLPIMGPTTVRDGGAVVVDKAVNPGTYVPGTGIVEGINDRANAEGALNFIDEAALDPYVFTRESFLQYRNNLINDGKTDASNYDDLDVDAAINDTAETSGTQKVAPQPNKANAAKPKAGTDSSSKLDGTLTSPSSKANNGTSQAFNSMSTSFQNAEQEFEEAALKMDEISKKKRRLRHR